MSSLGSSEIKRYQRQIILPYFGEEGQQKLKDARVLVIGAGGLGSPALMYLVAAGVGTVGIADYDRVDYGNLHRQVLYTSEDVGKLKTAAASQRLHQMNPGCHINIHNVKITRNNVIDLISLYDIVIDGTDNFPTRYLVSDATEIMGMPLVFGAVFQYYGQVSVFNYKEGPSYRCLFPEQPKPGEVPSCSTAGVLGVMPGIIGSLQAGEAIKIITGIGEPLSGRLMQIDILDFKTEIIKFSCDQDYKPVETLGEYNDTCDSTVQSMSPDDLRKEFAAGNNIIIYDLRPASEYDSFNIGGINITPEELMSNAGNIPSCEKIVVVCKTGDVSFAVADYLQNTEQIANVYSLEGGTDSWREVFD